MKNPILRKAIPLIGILLLFTFSFALAADNVKSTRGKVATVDLKGKFFIVNESKYIWNHNTTFSDEKGMPLKIDRLKQKALVFIEWEPVKGNWKRIAKRVCIYNEEE